MKRCRLCNEGAYLARLFMVRGCWIERCAACGFVQVRDKPADDELASIYSDQYFQASKYDDAFAQTKEHTKRLSILARLGSPRGARVLDVGCATGDFIHFVGSRFEMWGLDVSPYATEIARARNPDSAARIFTGFAEDQQFLPDFFDAITLWDVVEHLWDPVEALKKIVEFLRPGGYLVLSTPDVGAFSAKLMQKRWAFMTPPEHLGWFSAETMEQLIRTKLGLELVRSFSTGKWVNVGFLAYKLQRVFPKIPSQVVRRIRTSPVGGMAVYVPTADIQYVVARKP